MGSRPSAKIWTSINRLPPAAILAIVAAILMLPAFLFGTSPADSVPHNFAWIEGIAAEMHKGWIYPRWLSSGFEGLGSPSFYFYPPLPFLIMGAAKALAGDGLSTHAVIQGYAYLLLFASGVSMYVWARGFSDRGVALLCGIVYMMMPYHLFNHMVRGALGEFSAYAILPVLLLAMERIARGANFGITLFAGLYAALILTHLPATLLASVFVIPVYALWLNGARVSAVPGYVNLAVAGLLGTGLAAAYLIPALGLQEHINAQYWWTGHYDIRNWMIWRLGPGGQHFFLLMYVLYALYGIGLLHHRKIMPAQSAERRHMTFLILWTWAIMLLIAGIVPQIWSGVLAKVQFPWRLLLAVDLLMAVLIVLMAGYNRAGRGVILLCFAVTAVSFLVNNTRMILETHALVGEFKPFEPLEYRAAGYVAGAIDPQGPGMSPRDAGTVRMQWRGEEMIISVSAVKDARVVVPLSYFPAWVVTDAAGNAVTAEAATPSRLLSFMAAPGENSFAVKRIMLPEERMGWLISLTAGVMLLAGTLFRRRTRLSPP